MSRRHSRQTSGNDRVQETFLRVARHSPATSQNADFQEPDRTICQGLTGAVFGPGSFAASTQRLFEDEERLAMFSVVEIDRELPGSREVRCARQSVHRTQERREAGDQSKAREFHMCEYTSIARISVLGFDRWDW